MIWFGNKSKVITISELVERFLTASKERWPRHKNQSCTWDRYELSSRYLIRRFGEDAVDTFDKNRLREVRDIMIDEGNLNYPDRQKSRQYVNNSIRCIKTIFRWGNDRDIVPDSVTQSVMMLHQLKSGEANLRESEKVSSISIDIFEKTIACLMPPNADMFRVQLYTGMRSGEVCKMRPCDITEEEDGLLRYIPYSHKTERHGIERVIFIGPIAGSIVRKYITECTNDHEFLWSPQKTMEYLDSVHRNRHKKRKTLYADEYNSSVYYGLINRATKRAGVPLWHPHQLRHAFATRAANQYGAEYAKESLGHSSLKITQVYLDPSYDRARQVARENG